MTSRDLPVLIEPEQLEGLTNDERLLIVDLCKPEIYAQGHIPGAVHLEYRHLVTGSQPAAGQVPPDQDLAAVLSAIGCTPASRLVAYDDEGGGKAARLLWTLDIVGHEGFGLLNGGIHAWANGGHPLSSHGAPPAPSEYPVVIGEQGIADLEFILARLGDASLALLDARTPQEFSGIHTRAARGGHIPGAANLNWLDTMDASRNYRFKPDAELRAMLNERGITPDREVITYCHTHHRSAHSYIMLKHLGYERVRGYPGSWSEWGNRADTPVEV